MGEVGSTDLGGEPVGSYLGNSVNRIKETRHRHHSHSSGPNGDTIQTSTAIPSHTCIAQVTEHGEHWPPNVSKLTQCPREIKYCSRPSKHSTKERS